MHDEKTIRTAIKAKYDKLQECADALGISHSTLSRNIKRGTAEFIERLKIIGVDFSLPSQQLNQSVYYYKIVKSLLKKFTKNNIKGYLPIAQENYNDGRIAIKVPDDSMVSSDPRLSLLKNGYAIVDLNEQPLSGDIVAIELKSGRQFVRKATIEEAELVLQSYSAPDLRIKKNDVGKLYRVCGYISRYHKF